MRERALLWLWGMAAMAWRRMRVRVRVRVQAQATLAHGLSVLCVLDMRKPRQGRVNPPACGKRESSSSCPVPQSITLVRT